jgi:hypothetical protein
MTAFSTGPQKLLELALRYLPEERHEWGAAMRAELAHTRAHAGNSRGAARASRCFHHAEEDSL